MKKTLFLTLLVFCFHTLWAQNDEYSSKINSESVKLNTAKKTARLLTLYNFPQGYEEILNPFIADFEYKKEAAKHKYSEAQIQKEVYRLTADFEIWMESEIALIDKASILWETTALKHDLDAKYKTAFINYHFYLYRLNKGSSLTTQLFEQQANNQMVLDVTKLIADKETARVISKCSAVQGLDPTSIEYARENLAIHLQSLTAATLSSKSEIKLFRDSDLYCSFAYKKGLIKKKELDSEIFTARAEEVGLDAETSATVLALIETRKNELETLKYKKSKADEISQLFENTDLKTKTEIKREFGRNLAKTINRNQFSQLFGNVFMENVEEKSTAKIDDLRRSYDLNDSQLDEITKMIETYYFNLETTAAYYAFDKNLKKQKLSALRYKFQKEYKELMKSFNLEVKQGVKVDNRTYLWNN